MEGFEAMVVDCVVIGSSVGSTVDESQVPLNTQVFAMEEFSEPGAGNKKPRKVGKRSNSNKYYIDYGWAC